VCLRTNAAQTQADYEELLAAVDRRCAAIGCEADPSVVVTDFEAATMQAIKAVLEDHVATHGCFFHLTQSTWRKVQELGLSPLYRSDYEFRLFCGMLNAIAFVPLCDVQAAFQYVTSIAPSVAAPLVAYFDQTYVNGTIRSTNAGDRRLPPRYPPALWNVYQATVDGTPRTNNCAEGWNNHLQHMVGHKHPTVWRLIEALQSDAAETSTRIARYVAGNLSPKRQNKSTLRMETRLQKLVAEYSSGRRPMQDFLRAVGHNIVHVF
jgi:hypothetical protein